MRRSRYLRVLMALSVTLAATVASVLLTVLPSSAATGGAVPAGHTVTTTEPMHTVHVKKLVSATSDKPGWGKIQLANGEIVPVPRADEKGVMNRAAQESGTTAGTVTGDCGSSFITVSDKPNHYPVAMQTGFNVYTGATSFYWNASVDGPGYSHTYQSAGDLFFDTSWRGGYDSSENLPAGNYTADVNFGIAFLWDGDVCVSLNPTDHKFLTAPAKCLLRERPAGARTSGGGWINNTVTDVKHVNITTTPNGPGTRAATATACLRRPLVKGSTAQGTEITGWRDALLAASKYTPTAQVDRCHLIANELGGTGQPGDGGPRNLVPCWHAGVNTGVGVSMREDETEVRDTVNDTRLVGPEDAVYFRVTPVYHNGNSTIPYKIQLAAEVQHSNGTTTTLFSDTVNNVSSVNGYNLGN